MARDNSINKRYSKLEKEKLIARMLPPENISVTDLSKETREKGLFVEDVKKWHNACLNSTSGTADSDDFKELKLKQQEDAKRIRALEKDLQFKEKALAETAALLVLRKKLQAILVDNVED